MINWSHHNWTLYSVVNFLVIESGPSIQLALPLKTSLFNTFLFVLLNQLAVTAPLDVYLLYPFTSLKIRESKNILLT